MQSNLNKAFRILWEQLVLVVLSWFGFLSQWNLCVSQVCRFFVIYLSPASSSERIVLQCCGASAFFLLLLLDVFSSALFWRVDLALCFVKALALHWARDSNGEILRGLYLSAKTIVCCGGWKGERRNRGWPLRAPFSPIAKAFNCTFAWACL